MEGKDFYFQLVKEESGEEYFLITSCEYYDKEGCLDDDSGVPDNILPEGFGEMAEAMYEYDGSANKGREILLSIGMKEINFGFEKGEPSASGDDYREEENEMEDEEGEIAERYDDLDTLLNDKNEPNPFDYKNVSTDKLLRHRKVMVSTEAYEEAAKIRDELISRGVTDFN